MGLAMPAATFWRAVPPSPRWRRSTRTCVPPVQPMASGNPMVGRGQSPRPLRKNRPFLRPLPDHDFDCCVTLTVALNPYSQVTFETNRYSVPVEVARATLTLKAYPFRIDILDDQQLIARHSRRHGCDQDLFDAHPDYLPLLEQRPGAFEHARPLGAWRKTWPPVYEQLLAQLRATWPEGRGVREFIQVLKLHRDHLAAQIVTGHSTRPRAGLPASGWNSLAPASSCAKICRCRRRWI